jgi:hypothetical protein
MSLQGPTDSFGRKLYGDSVHQDFYPLHWISAPIAIYLFHFFVPTIITIVAAVIYAAMLMGNMVMMKPRDYVPRHLARAARRSAKAAILRKAGSNNP